MLSPHASKTIRSHRALDTQWTSHSPMLHIQHVCFHSIFNTDMWMHNRKKLTAKINLRFKHKPLSYSDTFTFHPEFIASNYAIISSSHDEFLSSSKSSWFFYSNQRRRSQNHVSNLNLFNFLRSFHLIVPLLSLSNYHSYRYIFLVIGFWWSSKSKSSNTNVLYT